MSSLYLMSEVKMLVFVLVLIRMIAFIVASPVFGSPQVAAHAKVLLSLVLAVCLFPVIKIDLKVYDGLANEIILLAAREALVGLCLGFLGRMFFYAISMTGEMVSVSLGLNAAQMFNPLMGNSGNIIEQFYNILGILFFFIVDGHQMLIGALAQSFEFVKIGQLGFNVAPLGEIATMAQVIFSMMIKMCAPVMVAIFLSQIAMGLLGRAIPQINVLVTSFPVTIMLGLMVMMICIPFYLQGLDGVMQVVASKMLQMMKAI